MAHMYGATTRISAADVIEAATNVVDISLTGDYSGRGMFGERCFGIIVDNMTDVTRFFVALAQIDGPLADDLLDHMATDSMGRGLIAYFPGYTTDKPLPEEEW